MTSPKRMSASARKKQIVDMAIKLAGEQGPDRMTAQQLADASGISQPAVFRHFANMAAIWDAVGARIAEIMRENAAQAARPDMPPAGQLRTMVTAQLQFINSTPAVPAILFSRELHVENETLRVYFAKLMAGRHQAFSDLIAREIAADGFRADLNPDDAAYLILALIQGLAMRWSLNEQGFDLVAEGTRLLDVQMRAFT